jgi:omega-amidase
MTDLHVTIVQSSLHWENVDRNLEMFDQKLRSITDGTDLIVLPEMFSTGFTMDTKGAAEEMNGKSMQWLAKKAKQKDCVITGSLIIHDNGHYYNRLVWMKPDGTFVHYDKRHLFRMAHEHEYFTAGKQRLVVLLKGWKICPLICYDLRFPVWSRNGYSTGTHDASYDCLIYVANWPDRRRHAWRTLLLARAIENQCYVIGLNRVGKDGKDIGYSGDSAVIDPKGEVISRTKPDEESIETVTMSMKGLEEFRKAFPVGMDADHFDIKL